VIQKLGTRKGEMKDMRVENGVTTLEFVIPTRGLIGFRNEFMMDTRGQGIINSLFLGYRPYVGELGSTNH
jgi:GTP-binding protein